MKRIITITLTLAIILTAALFTACRREPMLVDGMLVVNIGALRGPTGMGLAPLMEWAEDPSHSLWVGFETENIYNFVLGGSPDEMTVGLINGTLDIAMIPTNVASILYNRNGIDVNLIALKTLGVLFILDNTGEIETVEDLRGRTVNLAGQGSIPQFALEHILRENYLMPGLDVELAFRAEHTEVAALMVAGDIDIALLPQPFVTTVTLQNQAVQIALDLTKEWEAVSPGSTMVMTAVVVRTEFLEAHPEAVARFLADQEASINFANNNIDDAAEIIGRLEIVPTHVARIAIPHTNLVHIVGEEMRVLAQSFLSVMYDANPVSVGGNLPSEAFYVISIE